MIIRTIGSEQAVALKRKFLTDKIYYDTKQRGLEEISYHRQEDTGHSRREEVPQIMGGRIMEIFDHPETL